MKLDEKAIRNALVRKLHTDDPAGVVLHELPLARGKRRADVTCVNGMLAGFEIKSPVDTLARISGQAAAYSEVFELMTAVVATRHLNSLKTCLPRGWGILAVEQTSGTMVLREIRKGRLNRSQKNSTLARILWRDECSRILRARGLPIRRDGLIIHMWSELEKLPTRVLCEEVKLALKARGARQQRPQ